MDLIDMKFLSSLSESLNHLMDCKLYPFKFQGNNEIISFILNYKTLSEDELKLRALELRSSMGE